MKERTMTPEKAVIVLTEMFLKSMDGTYITGKERATLIAEALSRITGKQWKAQKSDAYELLCVTKTE